MNNMPPITKNLLIINVLVFLATIVADGYGIDLDRLLGLHFLASGEFQPHQFLTYMFMHGGFTHVFFNMFAVWMFGRTLEMVWGPKRFLTFYLVCGIGAGLVQELVTGVEYLTLTSGLAPDVVSQIAQEGGSVLAQQMNYVDHTMGSLNLLLNTPVVGASGAVYGILLGFGMLFPNERMYVFPLPVPIPAKYFVGGYAVIELMSGMANNPGDHVAHFAHLGGMLFAFLLILYWRKKNRYHGYYFN